MLKIIKFALLALGSSCTILVSCDKLVEIPDSKSQAETQIVFADSSSAVSALLGAYLTLSTSVYGNLKYLNLYSDEYNFTSSGPEQEFSRSLLLPNNPLNNAWGGLYLTIYQCNAVIEESEKSTNLSRTTKTLLIGEAKFLRAYANFYLINLYDHVPLILTTNVNLNKVARQNTEQQVYNQIINDLQDAKGELNINYPGTGKVRANKWAASALLSRVYLYQRNWTQAEREATSVINSGGYSPLPALNDVFQANSKETILQLWNQNGFLVDAPSMIPATATEIPQFTVTSTLYDSFDPLDGRAVKWIATNTITTGGEHALYHYSSKYKNRLTNTSQPEYATMLRLSELYLIRAESLAQLNNISGAITDLNVIRKRATGITLLVSSLSKEECLVAIEKERIREFFGEWAHRFLDLKRTGNLNGTMSALKTTWKVGARALPIPLSEITYNSNLIQNNGY